MKSLSGMTLAILIPAALAQDPRSAQVDELFARWNDPDSPGCAVAVLREGELLHLGTYGVRDVGTGEPITRQSAFYIASSSKQFTAACIVDLARQGELSLDDDVRSHIPELPDYGDTITVRHLLTHRSGLRDFLELMILAGWDLDAYHEEEKALELICRQDELNFAPGSDFGYSNAGYFLLAEIVRRVSGSSLREYAEENVFKPLGMSHTTFKDHPDQVIPELAVGHDPTASGSRARHTRFALVGSGGLYTTIDDLLKWQANFATGEWGGAELLREMQTPLPLQPDQGRSPELGRYAYGLIVRQHRGLPAVMHPGGSIGYQANMIRFPEQDLSILILANAAAVPATDLGFQIADIYLGDEYPAEVGGAVASDASRPRPGIRIFRGPELGDVLILNTRPNGSSLVATLSYKLEMRATGPFELRSVGSGLPVEARLISGESGGRNQLELRIENQNPQVFEELILGPPDREDQRSKLGEYTSEELGASVRLIERGGQLAIDDSGMAMAIPPFMSISRDTAVSDRGVQLDFIRDGEGNVSGVYLSTGRIHKLELTKR